MKKIFIAVFTLFYIGMFSSYFAQSAVQKGLDAVTENAVKAQLDFLASDWTEGREAGTKGNMMAADYIASMLKVYGIEPAGDEKLIYPSREERRRGVQPAKETTYFQTFSLVHNEPGEFSKLQMIEEFEGVKKTISFSPNADFALRAGAIGMQTASEIVFVGYGLKDEKNNYNDFEDVDVKGKFILRVTGFPGQRNEESETYKKFKPEGRYGIYRLRREKNKTASEEGAIGVLEVDLSGRNNFVKPENLPVRFNGANFEGKDQLRPGQVGSLSLLEDNIENSFVTVNIMKRVANVIMQNSGIDLSEFEKNMEINPKSSSKELEGKQINLDFEVESKLYVVWNILGKIEGKNPNEVVVVGGHYDHVGENNGFIWNGSDDNASGTVGVLTLAKAFAASGIKPEKTIIFALWTAEEKGLLGSKYFVDNFDKNKKILFNLNYDMISRDDDNDSLKNKCTFTYTENYPKLEENSKNYIKEFGINLDVTFEPRERPGGGSDHAPFSAVNIPIAYMMAGWHDDYHEYTDHTDKANIAKIAEIIKLGFLNINTIANSENFFEK